MLIRHSNGFPFDCCATCHVSGCDAKAVIPRVFKTQTNLRLGYRFRLINANFRVISVQETVIFLLWTEQFPEYHLVIVDTACVCPPCVVNGGRSLGYGGTSMDFEWDIGLRYRDINGQSWQSTCWTDWCPRAPRAKSSHYLHGLQPYRPPECGRFLDSRIT